MRPEPWVISATRAGSTGAEYSHRIHSRRKGTAGEPKSRKDDKGFVRPVGMKFHSVGFKGLHARQTRWAAKGHDVVRDGPDSQGDDGFPDPASRFRRVTLGRSRMTEPRNVRRWVPKLRPEWILVAAVVAYIAAWSYISLARFYALQSTVFDFGVEFSGLYGLLHPAGLSFSILLGHLAFPGELLESPLTLASSFPLLLVVQTIALGSGAIALYGIAKVVLRNPWHALPFGLVYLVYPPLAAVNWFDYHTQALFTPFFLFAYLALLRKRPILAMVLFVLAGGVYYPYAALVALFAAVGFAEPYLTKLLGTSDPDAEPESRRFYLVLFVASALLFAGQLAFFRDSGVSLTAITEVQVIGGAVPVVNRLFVLLLFLSPVLFLPLLSPRWTVMLVPFLYLEFASSYYRYSFPGILLDTPYPTIAIAVIFLGAIYGFRRFTGLLERTKANASPAPAPLPRRRRRTLSRAGYAVAALLIVSLSFAAVYQPYGPLNGVSGSSFDLAESTAVNWTLYNSLTHLVNLIPRSQPYVVYQNDMPEMLPRANYTSYIMAPLVAPDPFLNATAWDAQTNQWPVHPGYQLEGPPYIPLDFAIGNPNDPYWYTIGGSTSIQAILQTMYASGEYGLLAEAAGMTVLERGYTGPLADYAPWWTGVPVSSLFYGNTFQPLGANEYSWTNLANATAWSGPFSSLPPGQYRVTFSLRTDNPSGQNRINLTVATGLGTHESPYQVLGSREVTGSDFASANQFEHFSVNVTLTGYASDLQFAGYQAFWNGTLSLDQVGIYQYAPP